MTCKLGIVHSKRDVKSSFTQFENATVYMGHKDNEDKTKYIILPKNTIQSDKTSRPMTINLKQSRGSNTWEHLQMTTGSARGSNKNHGEKLNLLCGTTPT